MITFIKILKGLGPHQRTLVRIKDFRPACFPVRSHFASLQGVYYILLLLFNGSMSKTLTLYTTCGNLFHPHTGAVSFVNCDVIECFSHAKAVLNALLLCLFHDPTLLK